MAERNIHIPSPGMGWATPGIYPAGGAYVESDNKENVHIPKTGAYIETLDPPPPP